MTIEAARFEAALRLIRKDQGNLEYFFEKLDSPEWLEQLAAVGAFEPPRAVRIGDTVAFPRWTAGGYLARMASEPSAQPRTVELLLRLPPVDNPRVYEEISRAAVALPPEMAERLVAKILEGLALSFQALLPENAAKVVAHLARGGRSKSAIALAKTLFHVSLPPRREEANPERDELSIDWREPTGAVDEWEYSRAMALCRRPLVENAGVGAVKLFADLLNDAIRIRPGANAATSEDYSYIWCPDLAAAPESDSGATSILVAATRDCASELTAGSPALFEQVLAILDAYPWPLFRRLALLLLTAQDTPPVALREGMVADPTSLDRADWQPEYSRALRRHFVHLSDSTRVRYFEYIGAGPDTQRYRQFVGEMSGVTPTDEQVSTYAERWERDRLFTLGSGLPPKWRRRLDELVERHGPAEIVGAPQRARVFSIAPKSPLPDDSIQNWGWPELADYLGSWVATGDSWEAPSYEGLAGDLRLRIEKDLSGLVQNLHHFRRSRPEYHASILEGLRAQLKQEARLDWELVTDFLENRDTIDVSDPSRGAGGTWVAKCVASLLEDAFGAELPIGPSPSLRGRLWSILQSLSEHPDPTPGHELQYGGSNMDPQTLSLNTVRGVTFHAVCRYALWVRRHQEAGTEGFGRVEDGFQAMLEVEALLTRHLDRSIDPSLTVRAVYGQWFPWLVVLDRGWAASNAERIFSVTDERFDEWGWSAWSAYILYTMAYTSVLPILRQQYHVAIGATKAATEARDRSYRSHEKLAEHIISYYWRGDASLDEGSLVVRFFADAPEGVRAHALESVGRALRHGTDTPLAPEVAERLVELMEWRWGKPDFKGMEATSTGLWFGLNAFPVDWSFTLLRKVLEGGILPEPAHLVVEQLRKIAATHLGECVELLELMVIRSADDWGIVGWKQEATDILKMGLASEDVRIQEVSRRTIDRLVAMRFMEFRDLIKQDQ